MRLRLVKQDGMEAPAGEKGWRLLEQGELTLGRNAGSGWVLADPDRTVSGTHCRITRDAQGFALRDESTNGTSIDGRALAQGETVRLRNGTSISFCGHAFRAEITGEVEPDWVDPDGSLALGDEVPSITAILADVSPRGATASGILPGRLGDDWMDVKQSREPLPGAEAPLSRTPIGWDAPPDPSITAKQGGLPDDWNLDAETGSRSEHVVATTTRVRLPHMAKPAEPVAPAPAGGPSADDALDAFLRGLGESGEVIGDPLQFLDRMGGELHALRSALRNFEREMRELVDELGGATPSPAADLMTRLDEAREMRERMVDALRELLREADRLEPASIERRAAVEQGEPVGLTERFNPAAKGRRTWALFAKTYRGNASDGSPRARFVARLTGTATPLDDEFEELGSAAPPDGRTA